MMKLGQSIVLVVLLLSAESLVNSKVSLLTGSPTTKMARQKEPMGRLTKKGPLGRGRLTPTLVQPTSYLSLAITCHDAAIEVSTIGSNLFLNNFLIWISQYYFNAIIFQSIFVAIVFHS